MQVEKQDMEDLKTIYTSTLRLDFFKLLFYFQILEYFPQETGKIQLQGGNCQFHYCRAFFSK